jgi:hypothetical protein
LQHLILVKHKLIFTIIYVFKQSVNKAKNVATTSAVDHPGGSAGNAETTEEEAMNQYPWVIISGVFILHIHIFCYYIPGSL